MKWTSPQVGDRIFPVRPKDKARLKAILGTCPVVWHPDTRRRFKCVRGRCVCCAHPFWLKDEYRSLPDGLKVRSMPHPVFKGAMVPLPMDGVTEYDGTCCFVGFDGDGFCCTVHAHRPLRCRIYPYYPVFDPVSERIVILEEGWTESAMMSGTPCRGLGFGDPVGHDILEDCRRYLMGVVDDAEPLLAFVVGDPERIASLKS
jgi:hypothetical protein